MRHCEGRLCVNRISRGGASRKTFTSDDDGPDALSVTGVEAEEAAPAVLSATLPPAQAMEVPTAIPSLYKAATAVESPRYPPNCMCLYRGSGYTEIQNRAVSEEINNIQQVKTNIN